MNINELIDRVCKQIEKDLLVGDCTAIISLLKNIPSVQLEEFLPEGE